MKTNFILIICLFFLSTSVFGAMSLKEAFHAARNNMETLKRSEAVVEQSEELKTKARAAALPTISGVGSYTWIDRPSAAGTSPFLLTKQYSAALRMTQPIIRGGLVSAYQFAKENILLAKFQKDASEINLYQLVISAYYNLQIAQTDVKNLEEFMKLSRERVKELRDRTRIGRSRQGELIEAEAQQLSAESQHKQGLIALEQAQKVFEFYTKMKPDEVGTLSEVPKIKGTLQEYVNKVKTRPDILASEQQVRLADKQVSIAKGGHFPSLDLTGNYYFDRTGVLSTSDWDLGLAVVIPLFQGGGVSADVREKVEGKRIAVLNNSEALRTAERDIAISYQNLKQLQEQLSFVRGAMNKAEEAYRLNRKDYQNGLVTNLDVLQSLSYYIDSKRTYNSLFAMAHMNYKNLEAQIGVLP